ncbi:MAG: ABC-ATPase domain-containing protein [Acidobacteria bacterium]|nr:ABC-ATPase domain-containing protein [Acidobacteriota bacterium]MYG74070.1 ABC-ATPase domain-containing protein [Acidobacteriota bacterium]
MAGACRRLDGRGYPAYRDLEGEWSLGNGITVFVDRVARDPFAPPSRVRVRMDGETVGFPAALASNRARRTALADFLARRFGRAIPQSGSSAGSGHSGQIRIDAGGQEILERTAIRISGDPSGAGFVEARVEVGLPAAGRRILGHRAADLLTRELPAIAGRALVFRSLPEGAPESFVNAVENQHHLRSQLEARSLTAFVPDGAILPRAHGASERPLTDGVVPFESPASLRVSLSLLHPGDGPREIRGMGIPEGVTLIVGGGFHGKSTLLQALARSVVPHVPGDGRELVVTRGDAVTIRAEEGRAVSSVDVSPFIRELPGGRATTAFTTGNASGSTSQAASLVEALEAGSRLLLMDEDTSATNLMIRDARMQALVAREAEPIVALLDRVRELFERHAVSTILVMGGSGDYLDAADTVIQLADYRPREVTARAREVAARYPTRRSSEAGAAGFHGRERCPEPGSFDPAGRKGTPRIRATRRDLLLYGEEEVDLRAVEQLFDESQTRAAGYAMAAASRDCVGLPVSELLDVLDERLNEAGLETLTADGRAGAHPGRLARPRRYEIASALNRLRRGRFESRSSRTSNKSEGSH